MSWQKARLSEMLQHQSKFITIIDSQTYRRVRIRVHRQGMVLRDEVKGHEIKTKRQQICKAGQFLVAEIDAKVGGYGLVPPELEGAVVSSHYFLFDLDLKKIDPSYFDLFTKSDLFFSQIKAEGSTNYASIRPKDILKIEIPLPSLPEQKKIADEMNKFFNVRREIENMDNSNESYIKKLRQQILKDAIQGKLVKQDSKDEPASELLMKIKLEKEKLIKEGKIRKDRPLALISEDEIPYDLPNGWEWIYFRDLLNFRIGKTPKRGEPKYWSSGTFPWVSIRDMVDKGKIRYTREKITQLATKESFNNYISPKGTILMSFKLTLGKLSLLEMDACHNEAIISIFPYLEETKKYLWHFLPAILNIQKSKKNVLMGQTMNSDSLSRIIFPLPPLAEQKRIVEKVDKLIAYCDKLEKQVKENQENSEKLMGAVLKESFE